MKNDDSMLSSKMQRKNYAQLVSDHYLKAGHHPDHIAALLPQLTSDNPKAREAAQQYLMQNPVMLGDPSNPADQREVYRAVARARNWSAKWGHDGSSALDRAIEKIANPDDDAVAEAWAKQFPAR